MNLHIIASDSKPWYDQVNLVAANYGAVIFFVKHEGAHN